MLYTQLRAFHGVATEGGFTAASRVLNVGQPTLTSHVKALEVNFDVELFHRRGRRVVLTQAGHELFQLTRRMLHLEEESNDLLQAFGGLHRGVLQVGAVGPYHATEMLSTFSERYPDIRLSVAVGNSREMVTQLLDYRVDVAVLAHVEDNPHIHAIPYSRHPVVVFAHKSHPFFGRQSLRLRELEGQRMVLREQGSTTRLAFEQALADQGVSISPVMEIGSREAVWLAVAKGIGLGVVSDIEFIPHPDILPITVTDADIYTTAHVACLEDRKDSRMIRAFFEVAELGRLSRQEQSPVTEVT
ncbi:LysR substrate-binding domain-containing protein [Rhodovibrionaceae bacterium A322]